MGDELLVFLGGVCYFFGGKWPKAVSTGRCMLVVGLLAWLVHHGLHGGE